MKVVLNRLDEYCDSFLLLGQLIWEKQFKARQVYFGFWFPGSQSMGPWLLHFWVVRRQTWKWWACGGAELLTSWPGEERTLTDWLPPVFVPCRHSAYWMVLLLFEVGLTLSLLAHKQVISGNSLTDTHPDMCFTNFSGISQSINLMISITFAGMNNIFVHKS